MEINDSSLLTAADWDAEKGLIVTFKSNGARYQYSGVSHDVWVQFQEAVSKGKFFSANIKGQYTATKL